MKTIMLIVENLMSLHAIEVLSHPTDLDLFKKLVCELVNFEPWTV